MKTIQPNLINYSIFKEIGLFDSNVTISSAGIIHTSRQHCPTCKTLGCYNGSSNNGNHIMSHSIASFLQKGQQYCPKCDKTFQVENAWLDENIDFIREYVITQTLSLAYSLSEDEIVSHLKKSGIKISKSTVHNIITKSEEDLNGIEFEYELSDGFYCYDEQYLMIDGKRAYRIVLFDAKNDKVIYEKIHYKFSKKILQSILREVFGDNKPKGFVVDMKIEYPSAFRAVFGRKINIQFCIFHLNKLILKEYKDSLRIGSKVKWSLMHYHNLYLLFNIFYNRNFELNLLESYMKHHKRFVSTLTEKKVKYWVKKYNIKVKNYEKQRAKVIEICENKLMKSFRKILHDKKNLRRRQGKTLIVRSTDSAKKQLETLIQQKDYFPKKIASRIDKIKKNFEYFVGSEGVILTNNKLEGFFGATLKKFRKKLRRTIQSMSSMLKRKRLEQNGILCYKEFSIMEVTKVFMLVSLFS